MDWLSILWWTTDRITAAMNVVIAVGECLMVCVWEPIPHKEISQDDYCGETRSGR